MATTLTGEVERITFENEDSGFRVIRVGGVEGRGSVVVVGVFQAVGKGTRVRVTGQYQLDKRHGEQFRADSLVAIAPETLAGLEKYLGSGLVQGIGPKYAKRIVEKFGKDTLDVLDREPMRLQEVPGLGRKRAQSIQQTWAEHRTVSNLMVLLQTHGASPSLASKIVERYGDRAAGIVQQNPYRLAMDVRGIGFKTADALARSLGISGDHPERAQAGVLHLLHDLADGGGHLMSEREMLVDRASEMLAIESPHVEAAIDALWGGNRIVVEDGFVMLRRYHEAEVAIADHVARLLESPAVALDGLAAAMERFETAAGVQLAPEQRRAVEAAAEKKVVVITGGPGTGKTTIVRAIVSVLGRARLRTALAAPTGRAAKRLAEATRSEATTIHRLLEFEPRSATFQRDAKRPLDADALILDEASMIDVPLAKALLDAAGSAMRIVIVGDADQLPSVGPGAFLRDVISSGVVPTVRLQEIFRQAEQSGIVTNAHEILAGHEPTGSKDPEGDFFVLPRSGPEEAASTVLQLVTERIPKGFDLSPRDDVQVLSPMHRGPAGTLALNAALQAKLNPEGQTLTHRGRPFRAGDKVMQLKNDYDREVSNGDLGVVETVFPSDRRLRVRFDGRGVDYDEKDLDLLTLAYATSIHKSQGSEYAAVVVPFLTSHFVMLSRNLLYTAVTRAKRLCCLVADPRAISIALAETRREDRLTQLADRLEGAIRG